MAEQITIDVAPDGSLKLTVDGCTGSKCTSLTRDLEKALGNTTHDQKKPEFYQQGQQGATRGQF